MTRRWPDTLPGAERPGYQLQPIDPSLRTEMEVGARRLRRITRARRDSVTVSWRFEDDQMAAFRAWYGDDPWSLAGDSDALTGWSLTQMGRISDGILGPAGQLADKIRATPVAGEHRASLPLPMAAFQNRVLVLMASLRAAGMGFARLGLRTMEGTLAYADVNLGSGAVVGQAGLAGLKVEPRGKGWYRVILRADTSEGPEVPEFRIWPMPAPATPGYSGNNADGLHLCEHMVRLDSGHDLYLPTTASGHALGAGGGSAWFMAPLAFGGGFAEAECRFEGGWKASISQGLRWTVSATLEVRNA